MTSTKERPILFSGENIPPLLAGTKTQTRRIIPLRRLHVDYIGPQGRLNDPTMWGLEADDGEWYTLKAQPNYESREIRCRYGAPGDRLWVRETIAIESWTHEYGDTPPIPTDRPHTVIDHGEDWGKEWRWPHYRATDPDPDLTCTREGCRTCEAGEPGPHWRRSIHMPRWASRILLEITDVRVQRLQEISQDDAVAEGCDDIRDMKPLPGRVMYAGGPRDAYQILWESINGAGSWDANPWVWAITFKRITNGITVPIPTGS